MSRGGKAKVAFAKPPEPKFIRELKAQVGYKEPVGLDAKMKMKRGEGDGDGAEMEDREDRDDEKPTIVVMRDGDLTEEEVKEKIEEHKINETEVEEIPSDGRIMFKKPTKRENSDKDNDSDESRKHKKKKKEKKETKLLSFDEDEDDYS